jgi:hypothetical protein
MGTKSSGGRIPFRLWIGVTGHRHLPDDPSIVNNIRSVLGEIQADLLATTAHKRTVVKRYRSKVRTPIRFGIMSALAEGADRLVVEEVLVTEDSRFHAVLPLAPADYMLDFETSESKQRFVDLLNGADETIDLALEGISREASYERAGYYVADRCDVLVAIWDGEEAHGPGGSANVIHRAEHRGIPVYWVDSTGPPYQKHIKLQEGLSLSDCLPVADFVELDRYNAETVRERDILRAEQSAWLIGEARKQGLLDDLRPAVEWILPYLTRADLLSIRHRFRSGGVGTALAYMGAFAVVSASVYALFPRQTEEWVWLEIILMLASVILLDYGKAFGVHRRWIAYRALAERFRVAIFLWLAGVTQESDIEQGFYQNSGVRSGWYQRAVDEVWNMRPSVRVINDMPPKALGSFVSSALIRHQLNYYSKTSVTLRRRHRLLTFTIYLLFGLTLLSATLHLLDLVHSWNRNLLFASIVLPALAGATAAIRAEREDLRNSERFKHRAANLKDVDALMLSAATLVAIQSLTIQATEILLGENFRWMNIMRFHEFEL